MAHLNSAEGIQNMCATKIMIKSKSLRTGFLKPGGALDQGLISCFQNASQTLISSRPNPHEKNWRKIPFHSRKNDSHSLPLRVFFFFFFFADNCQLQ